MTGQDAVTTAKAFDDALALTGVILTKTDGDSRGGAALSVRQVTGKPIKFMGVGEKSDALGTILSRSNRFTNSWYGRCTQPDRRC